MVALISNPVPWEFIRHLFWKFPAPVSPATGEALWKQGIRFHGAQRLALESQARIKQVRGGVRGGKSFWTACEFYADICWEWETGHYDDLYWVIGPTYDQAMEEMRHLKRLFDGVGIPCSLNEPKHDAWTLSFPHRKTVVETKTGAEASRIAGRPVRKVAMVEAHQMAYEVYRAAKERVLETRGGVVVNGTFEPSEHDWFRAAAMNWPMQGELAEGESFPLPTWDNIVVFPGGRTDPAILQMQKELTPSEFMERLGGEPSVSSELVIPQARREYHIQHRFPHLGTSFDPEKPVQLWSDPGAAHAYAVLAVQIWKNVVWVIDAVYRWGRTVTEIIKEVTSRPWAKNVDTHVMDFAARQRRAEGPPIVEQWSKAWFEIMGKQMWCIADQVPLHAGYERHKKALLNGWPESEARNQFNNDGQIHGLVTNPSGPRVMFSPDAASPFFGPFVDGKAYAGEYTLHKNRKNNAGMFTSDDPIDGNNDAIKAMNYGLYNHFGPSDAKPELYKFWEPGAPEILWTISA